MACNWKNSLLPPKSPVPTISPSYTEYVPASVIGPKVIPKPREVNSHHQRASSESVLIEEQPLWLDELLNEPETPVRRGGHRRSSSDSFMYTDAANFGSMNSIFSQDDNKLKILTPAAAWGSRDFDIFSDIKRSSFYMDTIPSGKINKSWDSPLSSMAPSCRLSTLRGNSAIRNSVSLHSEKQDFVESFPQNPRVSDDRKDPFLVKSSSSETDTKRAKQQFAQRSRVRKLQYIAELERNVQGLQAQGSEVCAKLEFVNQQNLILSMENKALKQHLESLAQEQVIKYLEHEVLEKEVKRLRSLYQQQQQALQPPQFSSCHGHATSKDLDQQFANLSLKLKEPNTAHDAVSEKLHT